ncbi:Rv2732c family membrane protein [Williamsia sp. SKLECPSW1]
MSDGQHGTGSGAPAGLEQLEGDLRRAERRIAGEIDPGMRAVVVATAVLVAMVSMVLPHTGAANGIDVLTFSAHAHDERVTITSRVFVYLLVIFGIGFSMLALVTRRWAVAFIALCGSAVGCVAGMLAWWSRNTPGVSGATPPHGVGAGLVLGWLALIVIVFHWSRVVWARTSYHLALEAQRREEAAAAEERARSLQRSAGSTDHPAGSDRDPGEGSSS